MYEYVFYIDRVTPLCKYLLFDANVCVFINICIQLNYIYIYIYIYIYNKYDIYLINMIYNIITNDK